MYAIVEIAGKQYGVKAGDKVTTEKIKEADLGMKIKTDKVLLKVDGEKVEIGTPYLPNSSVEFTIKEHFKDEKIIVFKKKPKKRFQKRQGHRQQLTLVEVTRV